MPQPVVAHTVSPATGGVMDVSYDDDSSSSVSYGDDQDIPIKDLAAAAETAETAEAAEHYDSNETISTDIESNEGTYLTLPKKTKSVEWKDTVAFNFIGDDQDDDSDDSSTSAVGRHHSSTHGKRKRISKQASDMNAIETAMQQTNYKRHKMVFVASAAGLLAFNNGFLNGATLSGLASPSSDFPAMTVTGLTASYTLSGLSLSEGLWEAYGVHVGIIMSYFLGCFIAGFITHDAKPWRLEPSYGPTFLLGGLFLLIGGICAIFESYGVIAYWFSAAASGIQNGIASRYSANLIRCTVTGTTTDIGLVVAELVRGKKDNLDNGAILAIITGNFWLGGVVSFFAARRFLKYTLLANAVFFWVIGFCIIFFLVSELGLSVNAAVSGNWKWKKTMQSLRQASVSKDFSLIDMFDVIDKNKDGELSPAELLEGLLQAGVKTNLRTVKVLVNYADANRNGSIDREEWVTIVEKILEEGGSQRTAEEFNNDG